MTAISTLIFIVGISAAISTAAPEAKAQARCNLLTVKGSYGVLATGSFGPAQLATLGTVNFDGAGNISGQSTSSFSGSISSDSFTGTYTVNEDCSGTINFVYAFFTISGNTVIVDNGKELFLIETNPGAVASGVLKRQ
jgi:hypothetical protein